MRSLISVILVAVLLVVVGSVFFDWRLPGCSGRGGGDSPTTFMEADVDPLVADVSESVVDSLVLTLSVRGSGVYLPTGERIEVDQAVARAEQWLSEALNRVIHVQVTASALEQDIANLRLALTQSNVPFTFVFAAGQ